MKPVKTVKKAAPKKAAAKAKPKKAYKPLKAKPGETVLLSGGNPQVAKGYGDAAVQAYIAAMPGWKSDIGRKLDEAQFADWVKQASKLPGEKM